MAVVAEKSKDWTYSVHALTNQFEPEIQQRLRTREDAEILFDRVIDTANRLARYMTFHGPTRLKKKEYRIDYAVKGLKSLTGGQVKNADCIRNVTGRFQEPQYHKNLRPYCVGLTPCLT